MRPVFKVLLGLVLCALVVAVFAGKPKPAVVELALSPEQVAAEGKASKERSFDLDARIAAEMYIHNELIKDRGDSLPAHWKEQGEVIKREGNNAIVLVHGGIKEGMLSDLVVLQNYVLSVTMNSDGDRYSTTAAYKCGDRPTEAQIAMLMIKGGWPSVAAAIAAEAAKPTKTKRRAVADESE